MQKVKFNILTVVSVLVVVLPAPVGAVTHYVNPSQSIQDAIDASSNGDQIEVAPGTYYEAINFNGKAVRLYSSGGADLTTIDGTGNYHVVQCVNSEAPTTILAGFTITGGNANAYPDYYGGGMYNRFSSPTVTNCTFSGNTAESGGGMFNYQSRPTVTNCTFSGNTAYFTTSVDWPGGGGGMYNYQSSPTVTNCLFVGNLAFSPVEETFGGGMYNRDTSFSKLFNCTFSNNKASYGAGLSNCSECVAIIKNCIFWNDVSPIYLPVAEIFNHPTTGLADPGQDPDYIGYSVIIAGNSDIQYIEVVGPSHDQGGNIDADPKFVNPGYWDNNGTPEDITDDTWVNGDYHLSPGSPCIDAGSNLAVAKDDVDLDGDGITNEPVPMDMDKSSRFTDDPNTPDSGVYFIAGCPIVDMGAYEHPGIVPISGDNNNDGVVDLKDLAILSDNWLAGTEP